MPLRIAPHRRDLAGRQSAHFYPSRRNKKQGSHPPHSPSRKIFSWPQQETPWWQDSFSGKRTPSSILEISYCKRHVKKRRNKWPDRRLPTPPTRRVSPLYVPLKRLLIDCHSQTPVRAVPRHPRPDRCYGSRGFPSTYVC